MPTPLHDGDDVINDTVDEMDLDDIPSSQVSFTINKISPGPSVLSDHPVDDQIDDDDIPSSQGSSVSSTTSFATSIPMMISRTTTFLPSSTSITTSTSSTTSTSRTTLTGSQTSASNVSCGPDVDADGWQEISQWLLDGYETPRHIPNRTNTKAPTNNTASAKTPPPACDPNGKREWEWERVPPQIQEEWEQERAEFESSEKSWKEYEDARKLWCLPTRRDRDA
ncbi:hypothetical protein FN846DRAFT_885991 [Sphaerosporella brunnea]|uniref:Uncharacterized protein n=1 Tax=Sphaerosporella brunnea TaxID=1250544 RepID=A0A5J5F9Y8_9PEZI|nr:hypothetical protein FN846DRAFT_885991 [Sphaerosporella brunnea]